MAKKKSAAQKREFVKHDDLIIESLKDPKYAAVYLEGCLAEAGPDRLDLVLDAFRLVAQAHGFSQISRASGISRRTLYDAFKKEGNPTAETLIAMLDAAGLKLSVQPKKKRAQGV